MAFLLFGSFDSLAAAPIIDYALRSHGCIYPSRELFGDIAKWEMVYVDTPFSHSLEEGWVYLFDPAGAEAADVLASPGLIQGISRAFRRAGFRGEVGPRGVRQSLGRVNWPMMLTPELTIDMSPLAQTIAGALAAVQRSIEYQVPLLSVDAAGPAWISESVTVPRLKVLEVVWDEIEWLPRPKTLREALVVAQDARIQGLRKDIELWTNLLLVGKLEDLQDLRRTLRTKIRRFQNAPWASRVGRVVTYISLPIGIAETLTGRVGPGLGLSALGIASDRLASFTERHRRDSWLSLGREFGRYS
jgi:hypothetical protein